MTTRERWTVYPLLFLSLGLAMRAIVVPQGEFDAARVGALEATRLVCKELVLENDDGAILVHMGRVVGGGGGRIEIKDREGVDAIAVGTPPDGRDGKVEFFDAHGEPAGSLTAPADR
ncbi:MAG: hypothetical protein ACKOTB_09460 [Planctomycetia bacterium]